MKLLIDDANLEKIKSLYEFYPVDGVTTNPSILSKCLDRPMEGLKEIRSFIGKDAELHAQVISKKCGDMIKEAELICRELGDNTFVKVPAIPEGFAAIKILSERGFNTTATAVYTPMQAYLAAKASATYVAPYVNRIDNLGTDGIETVKIIQDILTRSGYKTEVVAASFKNVRQVQELCRYGIAAATVSCDLLEAFASSASIAQAVDAFVVDFEKAFGEEKTMLDFT